MALSGTLSSLGLDDVVGFLSTHGVEGVLTICGAAMSLRMLVLPGRLVVPQPRPGRLSAEALDALLMRAEKVGRTQSRRLSRETVDELVTRATRQRQERRARPPSGGHQKPAAGAGKKGATAATVSGRLSREVMDDLFARADALTGGNAETRRHKIAEQVHLVSAGGGARFEFTPCELPPEVVKELEALGAMSLEPLALLMEVARLADEHSQSPELGRTMVAAPKALKAAMADNPAALQGDIDGVGLAALLQTLRERRRAGTLLLQSSGREEKLYFIDGEAYALRTDADDEFAYQVLGVDAADSVRSLVREAAIDEQTLTAAEQARLRERFLDVLFGADAQFAFFDSDLPPEVIQPRRGLTRIALQTERFLLEAIQRMVEWDDLRGAIGDGKAHLRFTSADAKLTAIRDRGAPEVLTLIDGRLTFDEVVRAAQVPRLTAARVIAALVREGKLASG
jgi:hypothetical protein